MRSFFRIPAAGIACAGTAAAGMPCGRKNTADAFLGAPHAICREKIVTLPVRNDYILYDYGFQTRALQYAHPPQGGVRAADARARRDVCLRTYGLRRSAFGSRPSGRDLRPAVPLPQVAGLQGALRAQHHGCGPSGARCRRGRGQDRQEGAPRAARTDGGGALLYGALPPRDGRTQRRDPLDRAPRLGPHHRADRLRAADP